MRETYDKHLFPFRFFGFLVFVILVSHFMPALSSDKDTNSSLVAVISILISVCLVIWVLPGLVSVVDSFAIFFKSPIFKKRWKKFKSLKRGYYAFIIIVTLFVLSFFSEFIINNKAICVRYHGKWHFTVFSFANARTFGMKSYGQPNYRRLKQVYKVRNAERAERIKAGKATATDLKYKKWGNDIVVMPIYPYGPLESLLDELPCRPPHPPTWMKGAWREAYFDDCLYVFPKTRPSDSEIKNTYHHPEWVKLPQVELYHNMALAGLLPLKKGVKKPGTFSHILGTDDRGRDVFARMVYGFRISMAFSLIVTILSYAIGVSIGAFLGYFGGKFDIIVQRFVEIWSAMPFLYTVMIFAAIMIPNFWMLVGILVIFSWMGMTYFIRGEFYREKSKDYVFAARAIGCTDSTIIFKHILPNALTPVISFMPFSIVGNIGALVSLDFLGFGLPAPTPSWGELLGQGLASLTKPWLILSPTIAMFLTLLLVSFIGEAVREAFDPKQYSRLR